GTHPADPPRRARLQPGLQPRRHCSVRRHHHLCWRPERGQCRWDARWRGGRGAAGFPCLGERQDCPGRSRRNGGRRRGVDCALRGRRRSCGSLRSNRAGTRVGGARPGDRRPCGRAGRARRVDRDQCSCRRPSM
ncbi:putative endoribonuclease L-PSP family, partial [Arthrobacter sp. DR-2P]